MSSLEQLKAELNRRADSACNSRGSTHYVGCPCGILREIEALEERAETAEGALEEAASECPAPHERYIERWKSQARAARAKGGKK